MDTNSRRMSGKRHYKYLSFYSVGYFPGNGFPIYILGHIMTQCQFQTALLTLPFHICHFLISIKTNFSTITLFIPTICLILQLYTTTGQGLSEYADASPTGGHCGLHRGGRLRKVERHLGRLTRWAQWSVSDGCDSYLPVLKDCHHVYTNH